MCKGVIDNIPPSDIHNNRHNSCVLMYHKQNRVAMCAAVMYNVQSEE